MTLDASGLTIKTTAEILAEIEDSQRAAMGPQVQVGLRTPLGQVNSINAIQMGTLYQGIRAVNDSMDPDNAAGAQQDNIAGQNGVVRDPARRSAVLLDFTGTPTTVIPAGTVCRVPDGPRFETLEEATIDGGGDAEGVTAESEDTGPIEAIQDTITEMVTIIAGVDTVNNPEGAIEGNAVETDEALRQRREAGFSLASNSTDGSLRSRVGELDSVEQVLVVSNRDDDDDDDGRPPHSFEVIVTPAQIVDEPVWQVVFDNMPSGSKPYGDITGNATDSTGVEQPVAYSVASEIDIYFDIILTVDSLTYGGDDAVKANIVTFLGTFRIGQDVILDHAQGAIWPGIENVTTRVTGIIDIEVRAKVGSAPGPSDTDNIAIGLTEIANTDTGKITVDNGIP